MSQTDGSANVDFTITNFTATSVTISLTLPSGPPLANGNYSNEVVFQLWMGTSKTIGQIPNTINTDNLLKTYSINNGWYYYVLADTGTSTLVTSLKPNDVKSYTINFSDIRTWPNNEKNRDNAGTIAFTYAASQIYWLRINFIKGGGVCTNSNRIPRTDSASQIGVVGGKFVISSDPAATSWNLVTYPANMNVYRINYIQYKNPFTNTSGVWRAYGYSSSGTSGNAMAYSINGRTWNTISFDNSMYFGRYFEGKGFISGTDTQVNLGIAVGHRIVPPATTTQNILMYVDPINYKNKDSYNTLVLSFIPDDILFNGSGWVIVGRAVNIGDTTIWYYKAGLIKSENILAATGTGDAAKINLIAQIRWNGLMWIAAGYDDTVTPKIPKISYSEQLYGDTGWTSCTINGLSRGGIFDVGWSGSAWIAVCQDGGIFRSTDGKTWNSIYVNNGTFIAPTLGLYTVAWTGTVWVGSKGYPLYDRMSVSTDDGLTWTDNVSTVGSGIIAISTRVALIKLGNLTQVLPTITTPTISQIVPNTAWVFNVTPVLLYTKDGVTTNTLPTTAGSYKVEIDQTVQLLQNYDYYINNNTYLVVNFPTTVTITVGTYKYTNTGQGPGLEAVSASSLGALTFLYSGRNPTVYPSSTTKPTNIGDYTVRVDVAATTNYAAATATADFSIVQASWGITTAATTQLYNGSPYTFTYGTSSSGNTLYYYTSPVNLSTTVVYNSGTTTVTGMKSRGRYTVVITITDPNYTGTNSFPFDINPGNIDLTIYNTTSQYTGSVLGGVGPPTYTQNGETDTLTYYYNPTPSNVGNYTVSAGGSSSNYNYRVTNNTFTITPAPAIITLTNTGLLTQTYGSITPFKTAYTQGGSSNDVAISAIPTFPTGTIVYSFRNTANNNILSSPDQIGTYTVTMTATNTNYSYTTAATYSFTIRPLTIRYELDPTVVTYNTKWQSTNITYTPNCNTPWTYTGQNITYTTSQIPPSTVGSYEVNPILQNSNLVYSASGTNIFVINKANVKVTINAGTLFQYYTGYPIAIAYTTEIPVEAVDVTYKNSQNVPLSSPPTALGKYPVSAVIRDTNYQGSASSDLIISPVICQLIFENINVTFTGNPISATVYTIPGGHPVNLTYAPYDNPIYVAYPPTNVGRYLVRGIVDTTTQQNYLGQASTSMFISLLSIPLTITNNTQVFTSTVLTNTSITNPPDLKVIYTYTPSPPLAVGTYQVTGQIQDSNYTGSATSYLTITKATAPIRYSTLTQVYNTSNLYATILTTPPNLVTNTLYTVGTTTSRVGPVNVGTYTLVTTINDANYLGTNSATMNILKLSTFMTFSSLQQVYNGGYRSTIAITNPPDLGVSTFYNGSPIPPSSVGTYTVTGFIDNSNYAGYNTNILYINKLSTPVQLTNLNQNYTGSPIVPMVSVSPTSLLQNLLVSYKNISGTPISTLGPIINAGKYAVTALVQDTTYAGNSTSVLTIHPASTPIAFFSTSQIYTGKGLAPTFSTIPFNLSTYLTFYNSNALIKIPSTVGTYSVMASVIDSNNYFGNYGGTSTLSNFQITKATGSMTFVSSQIQRTYTGSNFPISVLRTSPSNLNVTYLYSNATYNSASPPSNVGSYTVIGSIQNQNYEGFGSTILNITQANAFIDFTNTSYPYDTLQHSSMYTTYPPSLTVITTFLYPNGNLTNVPPTDIGIYTQYGTIQDSSYAGTYTTPFIIYKGIAKITLPTITATYNTVAIPHPPITTDPPNLPVSTLTFTSFPSASYNSTVPPTNAGTYTMTATVNTDLYSNVASANFTITKRTIPVALTGLQQIYNGRPLSIHAVTEPAGLKTTFTYTYNSNPIAIPSSIGTYSVTGTLDDMNYQGHKTAQFAIALGPPQSLSAYAVDKGAVLAWTPPYGGVPIAEYEINTIPPTSAYTTTSTFTRINGLTNGIPYIFTVLGKNTLAPQGGLAYQAVVSTALTTSEFLGPSSIVATNGELYIADNHAIYQLSSGVLQVFAGSVGNPGYVDDQGIAARFNAPSGIVADSLGNLYVADTNNDAVRKVDRQANVTTYTRQIILRPRRIAIRPGYFFTTSIYNVISVIDGLSNVGYVAGNRYRNTGHADGHSFDAAFNAPQGIVVASNLDTYIADTSNHTIRKMDTLYNVTTIAGAPTKAGYVDATGSNARFSSPTGLAFNQEGNLFVADTGNNTIRKINTTTFEVTTIAGYGVQGDDNGDGANATFMQPNSLTFDSNMTMYVLEPNAIRTVTFTPIATATPTATPINYTPAAPTNLSATAEAGGSAITVRWTPPPPTVIPLTSYIVTYNTQTVTIDDGTISSYIIRNLVGNVAYTISVQAVNLFGVSAPSVPITYTISQIPVKFSITSTIIYDDQITNPPNFPVITATPSAPITLSYIDTTNTLVLAPSQIGIYTGTARVNTSQYAGISTFQFTILNSRPTAVQGANAVATNGQAIVRWIPPADIGESPITSYTVTSYPDNIVATTVDGLRTSISVGPLKNATAYFFTVVANNTRGSSPIVRTNTVIPVGPPSPPLNVAANINPQGIVTVTWSPPTSTNGAPISLYIINANPYNTAGLRVSIVVGGSTNTYRFTTGITPGVQYLFAVTAANAAGVSAPTPATYPSGAQYIVPYTIPDAPTITSAIASPGQITLSWNLLPPWITVPSIGPPSQLTITSFVVNVSPNIHNVLPFITSGTTTSLVIPNLTSKVAYAVSIYATNSIGNGLIANTQYITIPVSLTQTNPHQQNIPKWYLYSEKVPVTYSITNTAVFFTGFPQSPTIVLSIADVPYNLVYQDTFGNIVAQPTAVGEYYGTISVANDYYYGSQTFVFSILGNTPAMPTAIVVQQQGTFASPSVYLSWSAPQFTGQSPITYYTIVSNPATQTISSSITNTTITGLTSGVSYQFTITAYNTQGAGLPGKSSSITLYYTPSAPQASSTPSVVQSNGGVAISWLAPLFNGGLPILSYTLDITKGPTITNVQTTGYTIPPSVFVFGQLYSVKVYAVNRTGTSTALTIGPFTSGIATSAPVASTPIVPDYNNGTLRLNWLAPLDLNGSAVLYYTLYPRNQTNSTTPPPIRVGNVLSYTLSGLLYGATYSFTVTATNDYGESVGLNLGTAIPGKPPSTPQYVGPALSVENVIIFWGPSVEANDIQSVIYTVGILGTSTSFFTTDTSFQFNGLTAGQTYIFTVVARNRFGTSGTLNIGPFVNGNPPSAPTNLRVTNVSPNYDVVLTWDNSSGSPPISYNLVVNQATYNGVTSPFNVPNLLNGVQTTFQLFARNAVATSAPATLTYTPIVLAQTPQNPQVKFLSLTPMLTWTQSDVAQINNFLVTLYYNTLSNAFFGLTRSDITINGSSITFSGLSVTNGPGSYSYSIVANNGNTQSAPAMTNTVSLEAPLFIPQSPQSVVFSINDRNNQYLTWIQPDIRIVTSYTLMLYNNGSLIDTIRPGMFDLKIIGIQVSYTLLPLGIPGDYYYTIVAGNDYGDSTPVQTNTVSINTILPPTAVIARNNQIYFNCSWLGGNGLTYNVQFLLYNQITQVTTTIVSVQRFPFTYFSYTVPSLYLGSSYYFVVTSVASDGRTSASVKSNNIDI